MRKFAIIMAFCTTTLTGSFAMAENIPSVPAKPASADAPESAGSDSKAPIKDTAKSDTTAGGNPAQSGNANAASPDIVTDAVLEKQLREVGTKVDTLKEDTFTTKSRLLLLREEVLQRSISGARLQVRHKNEMGGQYELVKIYYAIDQDPIFVREDASGSLNDIDDEVISDKMLAPGPHQITVLYVYRGKPWGVFRYMTDYTFRVESGYDFIIDEGKAAEIVVTADEKGNAFTAYEDRPTATFKFQQYDLMKKNANDDSEKQTKTPPPEKKEDK